MLVLRRSFIPAAFASILGFAAPLGAQSSFDLAPLFAYYRPTGGFTTPSVYTVSLPVRPSDLSGTAWGAEAHFWFNRRLGVQAQAAVSNSLMGETFTPIGMLGPWRAQTLVATVQAQYDLSPSPDTYRLWVSAGPGLVRRSGNAYSDAEVGSPVSVGGAFGVGLNVPIVSRVRATVGAETLVYELHVQMPREFRLNPGEMESGLQNDLLLHVGLAWGWR